MYLNVAWKIARWVHVPVHVGIPMGVSILRSFLHAAEQKRVRT